MLFGLFSKKKKLLKAIENGEVDVVSSLLEGFDKFNEIEGRLWGIKGQYLMFDNGSVLNIRKHNGYELTLEI